MKQKVGLCCALDPRARPSDPRRADDGRRSIVAPAVLGTHRHIRAGRPGMSVLVSTAYMDEAERLDWIVAMDAGRCSPPARRKNSWRGPGTKDLERPSFASAEEKRGGHAN